MQNNKGIIKEKIDFITENNIFNQANAVYS